MKIISNVLPLIFFFALIFFFRSCGDKSPSQISLINKPTPVFSLPILENTWQLADNSMFLGKISVLNLWSSWCGQCKREHDNIMELSEQENILSGRVQLIGVNVGENRNKAIQYLNKRGNPYSTVIEDREWSFGKNLGATGTPSTYIIDKNGVIRYIYTGYKDNRAISNVIIPIIEFLENEK